MVSEYFESNGDKVVPKVSIENLEAGKPREAGNTPSASALAGPSPSRPSRQRLVLAFAAVYLIWGSTYLGIKIAIETIPPFLMAGLRFTIAGSLLYFWMVRRGSAAPTRAQWRSAAMIGALLFLGGNGALTWAELRVDSGLASLLVSTIPLWMVFITHAQHKGKHDRTRLGGQVIAGLALGLVGIGLLVGPSELFGHGGVDHLGAGVLLCGSLAWTLGSLYSPKANLPKSTMLAASMEMICGGVLLILLGLATRETTGLDFGAISMRSMLGFLYLISFGSLLGFTSYNWLLSHATPARVSTYAYVNPVVAVFLGWAIADEVVTARTLTAAALVVAAVALLITHREHKTVPQRVEDAPTSPLGEEQTPPVVPLD
jgi:drug/metabolite transporter (DMT)-like permease